MSFNGWKLLVMAPVALTLLSACGGGKNKNQDAYRSPYAGSWLGAQAARDYLDTRGSGNFCEVARSHPEVHGFQNRRVTMPAWQIYPDGRLFRWGPSLYRTNIGSMRGLGTIDPRGYMTPYGAGAAQIDPRASAQSWAFRRTNDTLYVGLPGEDQYYQFLPLSRAQMEDYATQVEICFNVRIQDRSFSTFSEHGSGVMPIDRMFGGAPPPPGAAFAGEEPYGPEAGQVDPRLNPEGQLPPQRRK